MSTITTNVPNPLVETAKDLLSKYICVFDTYSNFQRANDLYFDSIAMIEDGFLEEMFEGEYLALYEENKYYQECIAAGEAELVLFGIPKWTALPLFPGIIYPVNNPIPLDQVECFKICANTVPGYASVVPKNYASVCWNLTTPLRLNNEDELLEWLDRVLDEFKLIEWTFLTLRLPDGELFTVYGPRFGGWIYS